MVGISVGITGICSLASIGGLPWGKTFFFGDLKSTTDAAAEEALGNEARRRLSPAESVLEAINGTHHRRLAPLELLLKQIEASKQASLQTKIHSERNRI